MIKKGIQAIQESLLKGQGTKDYPDTNWISWKGGETKVVRFFTDIDEIMVVSVHGMVDTFDGKKANFVCRSVFDAPCELCQKEVYKRDAGYGIAVVRQPVFEMVDGSNKIVGYEDQVIEYDEETPQGIARKRKPVVGIVNQSMRNFWNYVALVHEKYGSLNSYDIEIHRQGSGTDTSYAMFQIPEKPIENMQARYEKFVPDIEGFLTRIGSEEYYNARLHGIILDKKGESQNSSISAPMPQSNTGVDFEELTTAERLKAKLVDSPYG